MIRKVNSSGKKLNNSDERRLRLHLTQHLMKWKHRNEHFAKMSIHAVAESHKYLADRTSNKTWRRMSHTELTPRTCCMFFITTAKRQRGCFVGNFSRTLSYIDVWGMFPSAGGQPASLCELI
jgi:hypothetical protein